MTQSKWPEQHFVVVTQHHKLDMASKQSSIAVSSVKLPNIVSDPLLLTGTLANHSWQEDIED